MINDSSNHSVTPKVVLITGSAKRIGAHIAALFHERGFDVVLHYHQSAEAAKQLRDQFNSVRADSCIALQADLNQPSACEQLATQTIHWKQRLDVLINNASTFYPTGFGTTDSAQWDDLFASNAQAPFFLTQQLLPQLQHAQGCVINLIDALVDHPSAKFAPYCMAKSALKTLTLALAKDLAPEVRVNGVSPGAILWPEHEELDEQIKQTILEGIPLGRQGTPQDIAKAIWFLCEEAPYITGQILAVDGGRSLS